LKRRPSAFTLIELLAVMAILTLLIGILVPSLSAARRQAKANVCLSKMKGIATAFVVYLNENKDTFPPHRLRKLYPIASDDPGLEYYNEYLAKSPRWQWFLEMESGPVIDPKPMQRLRRPWGDVEAGLTKFTTTMTIDVFTCPALDDEEFAKDIRNGAYGYNYQYLGNARQDSDPNRWDNFSVPMHRIKAPAGTVLMADSRGAGPRAHGIHSYTLDPPRLAIEQNAKYFGPPKTELPDNLTKEEKELFTFSPVEMRHRGLGNVAFVDTHVEAMTLKQLGYDLNDKNIPIPVLYELNDKNIPIPVLDPTNPTIEATNRLWTGLGADRFADERAQAKPP
jgi:prepilin-type N-terminal cleavage/methylation domain-containing protein/prepilin-type processing-associated H-X9-DG protein